MNVVQLSQIHQIEGVDYDRIEVHQGYTVYHFNTMAELVEAMEDGATFDGPDPSELIVFWPRVYRHWTPEGQAYRYLYVKLMRSEETGRRIRENWKRKYEARGKTTITWAELDDHVRKAICDIKQE